MQVLTLLGHLATWGKISVRAGGDSTVLATAQEGGLYGLAYHINVDAAATAFGFEPTAIDDWATALLLSTPTLAA